MATKTSVKFKFVRGVTFERTFRYKDPAGDPIDLTGSTVAFGYRRRDEEELTLEIESGDAATDNGSLITITDAAEGEIELKITDEETDAIRFDRGYWWLNLLTSGDIRRIGHGELEILNP